LISHPVSLFQYFLVRHPQLKFRNPVRIWRSRSRSSAVVFNRN
jgi:hypothetical protein